MSTFSLGISGLSAAKKHLNTVGNNIANASTVGFKKSRAEFADVYAKSGLGSATGLTGNGVRVSNIAQQFAQGGTTFTQNTLDLAIDGSGFFIVKDNNGTTSYTRAGMFGIDKEGFVVSSTGQKLQGYPANANGDDISVGVIDNIYISQSNVEPNATSEVNIAFNLDSRAEPPTNYIFDPNDSDTYTHIYPSVLYDSLGNSHTMTQYFVKQPPYLPEYGEPTRAVQTMLGVVRYGDQYMTASEYGSLTNDYSAVDPDGVFPGDSDDDGAFDADIGNLLTNKGSFDLSGDITAANLGDPTLAYDDVALTDAQRGTRLTTMKNTLENLIDNSTGRTKEYYEGIYEAFTDYLPSIPSDVTVAVFEGALTEIEGAIKDSEIAYSRIDVASGRARDQILTLGTNALTDDLDISNVNPALTVDQLKEIVQNLIDEIEARRDGASFTPITTAGTAWGTSYINDSPSSEEAGVYQLALNAIQDVEKDWGDVTSAQETALNIINAIESEAAENRWHMHVTIDGETVTDDNTNTPDYFSFNFTEFGQLEEPMPNMYIKDWVPKDALGNQNGSNEPQVFQIDLTNTTQFAGAFGANSLYQDGYATGELAGLDIDDSGTIIARYTNSQTQLIGQVALANFRNEQGLTPIGGTMWAASTKSGDPVVNQPGVSVAGNIMSKALEDSNVDLSEELVEMIIAQRDYQANAKTLQTADTITQTIINLR